MIEPDLDARLFREEPGGDRFEPIYPNTKRIAIMTSQGGGDRNPLPIDGRKQKYLEALLQNRGLILHSHYPSLTSLQGYIAETVLLGLSNCVC